MTMPGWTVVEILGYARQGLRACRMLQNADAGKVFEATVEVLTDPNTKRLVLDARQAAVFAESGGVPDFVQSKLKLPFEQFYVELTEPVAVGLPEDGFENRVHGFFVMPNGQLDGKPVVLLAVFFKTVKADGTEEWGDHEFTFDVATGHCFVTKNACTLRWQLYRESIAIQSNPSTLPQSLGGTEPFRAGTFFPEMPIRTVGWWELYVQEMGAFLSWFLSYTMSKSVRIVRLHAGAAASGNRKLKRRVLKGRVPMPWHAVTVEPAFADGGQPGGRDSGRSHDYRYDVIGHLRFGRHKGKDGSYTRSIEWVRPHQRGLKNTLYIPKTYRVKGGRVPSAKMREYFKP